MIHRNMMSPHILRSIILAAETLINDENNNYLILKFLQIVLIFLKRSQRGGYMVPSTCDPSIRDTLLNT